MIESLYTSVSGMVAGMWQQARIAQNLTNTNTVGYKALHVSLSEFAALLNTIQNEVGETGDGVDIGSEVTDFSQGSLQLTNRQLDVALNGQGFLQVLTPSGECFTRAGHLHRDATGQLRTSNDYAVLGQNGPITLPVGDVLISPRGEIAVDGQGIDSLALVEFDEPGSNLERVGGTLYIAKEGTAPAPATKTQVVQGSLETANVDVASEMSNLIAVTRLYQLCQRSAMAQDEILRQASNDLGQV